MHAYVRVPCREAPGITSSREGGERGWGMGVFYIQVEVMTAGTVVTTEEVIGL